MPSADFCLITRRVAPHSAVGFHRVRLHRVMDSIHQGFNQDLTGNFDRLLVKQISPDKNVHCHYATASFTLPIRSRGFDVLGHLASRLSLI
jgi:hypothetical protein